MTIWPAILAGPCGRPPKTLPYCERRTVEVSALGIFPGFRHLVEAIQALTDTLLIAVNTQRELGPAFDRLEKLERSRVHFEAECEGMLLKADGKLKAASAAEQRERQLKRANEKLVDSFDIEGEGGAAPGPYVQLDDVAPSEEEGLPAVRLALATNNKAHAQRMKWNAPGA